MANHRNLAVLDASDLIADEINRLIDSHPRRLIHVYQLRKAAQLIGANISEGFGRGPGPERDQKLRVSRGEAEETIRHLRVNYASSRIARTEYWRLRNRLVAIIRMLSSLLREEYTMDPELDDDKRDAASG